MTPLCVTVRGMYQASLPGGDPVFQSSCCGNSYCDEGSKILLWIIAPLIVNCVPIWLRSRVILSMVHDAMNGRGTHLLIVFE